MPLPAPATAELLKGLRVTPTTLTRELVTPTGAALLRGLEAKISELLPSDSLIEIGWGAGTIDLPDRPNLLRALLFEPPGSASTSAEPSAPPQQAWLIETNIDDSSPEQLAYLSAQLLERGALDVWQTPITMKKGRLAVTLSVLCRLTERGELERLILSDSSALGVRTSFVERTILDRTIHVVETPIGEARVKVARGAGGERLRVSPEYEDASKLASQSARPLSEVYALILETAERSVF
jgi:uncharacterized protein (DUF111 family)